MDRELASDAIAQFLNADDASRKQLKSTSAPPRPVEILRRSWDPWLRDGGRPGTTSYVGPLDPARVAAAADAMKGLTARDPARLGADLEIDRSHLLDLSRRAAKSNARRCVTLWVAAMVWGSGTLNGRGPWRTAQGLAHVELGPILVASHQHLRAGEIAEAYEVAATIPGSAEASFTKWLWAAALGLPDLQPSPLVLDHRLRRSLATLDVRPQHNAAGYVDYLRAADLAATKLRRSHGYKAATAEKVELLLAQVST